MRESLTKLLNIPKGADLTTHNALLQLATSPTGDKRLITTNFDHGFLLADPSSKDISHAAPRLPVPRIKPAETGQK